MHREEAAGVDRAGDQGQEGAKLLVGTARSGATRQAPQIIYGHIQIQKQETSDCYDSDRLRVKDNA
jgi:hypothetical protein